MRTYRYQITNKHGDILDLSNSRYRLDELPDVKRNRSLQPRQNTDGSVLLGDGKITDRKIQLKFDYASSTGSRADRVDDVYELLNILGGFFRMQDAPFYCVNLERDVRIRVYGDFAPAHAPGAQFRILKDSTIMLDLIDAHWEDSTATTSADTALDSGETMTLSPALPTYSSDVFPIITITGTATSPTVFAIETGRIESLVFVPFRSMLLTEPEFGNGDEIVIDSVEGRVYFNGQEKLEMLTSGYPVKFDRRNQVLRFSSQDGTGDIMCTIEHRVRSLFG